eukprot:jgi/Ulvmu1/6344/UM029_0052.1
MRPKYKPMRKPCVLHVVMSTGALNRSFQDFRRQHPLSRMPPTASSSSSLDKAGVSASTSRAQAWHRPPSTGATPSLVHHTTQPPAVRPQAHATRSSSSRHPRRQLTPGAVHLPTLLCVCPHRHMICPSSSAPPASAPLHSCRRPTRHIYPSRFISTPQPLPCPAARRPPESTLLSCLPSDPPYPAAPVHPQHHRSTSHTAAPSHRLSAHKCLQPRVVYRAFSSAIHPHACGTHSHASEAASRFIKPCPLEPRNLRRADHCTVPARDIEQPHHRPIALCHRSLHPASRSSTLPLDVYCRRCPLSKIFQSVRSTATCSCDDCCTTTVPSSVLSVGLLHCISVL